MSTARRSAAAIVETAKVVVMFLSYVHGTSDTPLLGETIGALLDRVTRSHGSHEALVVPYQDVRWSYAELAQRCNDLAAGLVQSGWRYRTRFR